MLLDHSKLQGITQSDLAWSTGGIKHSTVSNIENNPATAKVDTLFKLLNGLGLEIHFVEKCKFVVL